MMMEKKKNRKRSLYMVHTRNKTLLWNIVADHFDLCNSFKATLNDDNNTRPTDWTTIHFSMFVAIQNKITALRAKQPRKAPLNGYHTLQRRGLSAWSHRLEPTAAPAANWPQVRWYLSNGDRAIGNKFFIEIQVKQVFLWKARPQN